MACPIITITYISFLFHFQYLHGLDCDMSSSWYQRRYAHVHIAHLNAGILTWRCFPASSKQQLLRSLQLLDVTSHAVCFVWEIAFSSPGITDLNGKVCASLNCAGRVNQTVQQITEIPYLQYFIAGSEKTSSTN